MNVKSMNVKSTRDGNMKTRTEAAPWKVLLLVNSLLASVVGWMGLAVHDTSQGGIREPSAMVREPLVEVELGEDGVPELLPPIPSLHRPVTVTRPSR